MTSYNDDGGTPYDSKAEAAAAPDFAALGCIRSSGFYPQTFRDADGTQFPAKPDWFNPSCGLWIEFKAGPLNGTKTKATAQRAIASKQEFKGSLSLWDWLKCGWHHSAAKIAITQSAIAASGGALLLVFAAMPDAETIKRLDSRQVFWLVLGTPEWRQFASFLKFASSGFPARLLYRHPESGQPLHEFRTRSFAS